MLRVLGFTFLGVAYAGACFAADLSSPPVLPPVPAAADPWSGPYAGLSLGYGGDSDRYPYSFTTPTSRLQQQVASLSSTGLVGGGFAGYNVYLPQVAGGALLGLEAEANGGSIDGNSFISGKLPSGNGRLGAGIGSKGVFFGSVRARAGYVLGGFLVYATGGGAILDQVTTLSGSVGQTVTQGGLSSSQIHQGVVFGGGAAYPLAPQFVARIEYLRGTFDTKNALNVQTARQAFSVGVRPTENFIRGALEYHFDFARYQTY